MYALIVKVRIKPEHAEAYVTAAIEFDAAGSVQNEPGCLRFDVIRDENDPNVVCFYEVYRDKDAFAAHTKTAHIARFREVTAGWTEGSEVVRGFSAYPADDRWVKQV